jgi:hypothetical protein
VVVIETIIVMVGICVCAFLLSKADVHITISHKYPQAEFPATTEKPLPTGDYIDDLYKKADIPTMDDVMQIAQELIAGGDYDVKG